MSAGEKKPRPASASPARGVGGTRAAPFATLVADAQAALQGASLSFNWERREAVCGHQSVKLPPSLLAWYAWWALCRRDNSGEEGFVRYSDLPPDRLIELLQRIVGRDHPSVNLARQALRNGFEASQFQQKATKINRALSAALAPGSAPYRIETMGKRPNTRYGIKLSPGCISIP